MGVAMVSGERDFAINAKVSSAAANRLKKLALRRGKSYGEVLDALLLEVPIEQAEWETPLNDALSRIAALEAQVASLLSSSATVTETESLPHVVVVVKPDTVESVHQSGDLGASEDQAVVEVVAGRIASEIAPGAAVDAIEREAAEASILPKSPTKRSVKQFINDLVANGECSPSGIARALNEAGYRTQTKTEFQRSNPQITTALDQVRGK